MMAVTTVRSCSILKMMSRLPTLAEIRCLHRTVGIMKPVLQSLDVSANIQPNVPVVCRNLHTTNTLLKKVKEELYEKCRVYSPDGQYLCTTELFVVDKLCHKFHRYSHLHVTNAPSSPNSDENSSLKAVQLIDKKPNVSEETEKKIKLIKFKKDVSSTAKMPKIMEILVNSGQVNLHFERTGTKGETDVKQRLSKFATLSQPTDAERGFYQLATLKTVDSTLLNHLLELIQNENATHLAAAREMLEIVKKDKL